MCGKFLEWNKRIFNDDKPFIGWNYTNDGQGNSEFKMFLGGSKFWCTRGQIPEKKRKLIEIEEQDLYLE